MKAAEEFISSAILLTEKIFGIDHYTLAVYYENLSDIVLKRLDQSKARDYL